MKFVIFNDIQLIVSFRNDLILVTMNMKTVRGIRLLIYGSKLFSSTDCCFFFTQMLIPFVILLLI